jgi:hypothetical protein
LLPNLTYLSLFQSHIGSGEEFITLVSALERNVSLLHLDVRMCRGFSERSFLALAESLPEIKVLQRIDLTWHSGLASSMPLVLAALRKNTSLFRFHVAGCQYDFIPPSTEDTDICEGGWMQEMERLGYRNRLRTLIRAPTEELPPRGIWSYALARVAPLPDVIFDVLRSKPSWVPSEDVEG